MDNATRCHGLVQIVQVGATTTVRHQVLGPWSGRCRAHTSLEGQKINSMGYLVDSKDNVIDRWSKNILFQKDILEDRFGQEAEIPAIFRSGKLRRPEDEIEKQLHKKLEKAMKKGRSSLLGRGGGAEGDSDDDDDMLDDLEKIEKR